VRVSPVQLGAMSIGDRWGPIGMGEMDKAASFKLLDAYYEAGGNFIDTANNYQEGSSEEFIGEWMEERGIRDQIVLATKYTTNYHKMNEDIKWKPNYTGNGAKSLHVSVQDSLKKLRTSYIDILYLHWWDYATSVKEVMDSLHILVVQGKVLYLGISDTPAWVVAQANQYAIDHGKTPFVIYQGLWNVLNRSFERDIIPMARAFGMALAPWSVLAAGKIRSDEEEKRRLETGEKGRTLSGNEWMRTENEKKVCDALEKVAKEVGAQHIGSVAIAYVMQKTTHVFPIIGGRKVEHLMQNLEALDIALTPEHISYIESVIPFDPGFPTTMIGDGTRDSVMVASSAKFDRWPLPQPIRPGQ